MRFHCKICDTTFKKFVLFEGHFDFNEKCREKHRSFVQCYLCSQEFRHSAALKYHLQQHSIKRANKLLPKQQRKPKIPPTRVIPTITLKKQWHFKIVPNQAEEVDVKHTEPKSSQLECKICGDKFGSLFHLAQHSTIHDKNLPTSSTEAVEFAIEKSESTVTVQDAPSTASKSTDAPNRNQCPVCKIILSTGGERLALHVQQHTDGKFECKICKIKFSRNSLAWHNKHFHGIQGRIKCQTCGALFTTRTALATHESIIHKQGKVQCKICKIRFTANTLRLHHNQKLCRGKRVLVNHQSQNNGGNIMIKNGRCSICKAIVHSRHAEHIQNHRTGKFKCEVCDIRFSYKSFVWHQKRHHPEADTSWMNKKARCTICNAAIKERNFAEHMENHKTVNSDTVKTGNSDAVTGPTKKKNVCTICEAVVKPEKHAAHMQNHKTGKFKCEVCDIRFSMLSFVWHQRREHPEVDIRSIIRKCNICKAIVPDGCSVSKHHRVHEIGEVKCEVCNIRFTAKTLLVHEKKFHPELQRSLFVKQPCEICKIICNSKAALDSHADMHENGQFECETHQIKFTFEALQAHNKRFHATATPAQKMRRVLVDRQRKLRNRLKKIAYYAQFQCKYCKLHFSDAKKLEYHNSIHTDGDVECRVCKIPFTKGSLVIHEKRFHPEAVRKERVLKAIHRHLSDELQTLNELESKDIPIILEDQYQQLTAENNLKNQCILCKLPCGKGIRLDKHLTLHIDGEYKCEICSVWFTKNSLDYHQRRFHLQFYEERMSNGIRLIKEHCEDVKENEFSEKKNPKISQKRCDICNVAYKFSLDEHKLTHITGDAECKVCNIRFTANALRYHQKRYHPEMYQKPQIIECTVCKLTFTDRKYWETHQTVHTEADTQCDICNIPFTTPSLRYHMKRFHGNVYSTEIVAKALERNVVEHHQTSTNSSTHEPFLNERQCQICSLKCSSRKHFLAHMKVHANGNIKCPVCHIWFTQQSLDFHCKRFHPDLNIEHQENKSEAQHPCNVCKYVAWDDSRLREHKKVHRGNRKCRICNIRFTKVSLIYHYTRFHPNLTNKEQILKSIENCATKKNLHNCPKCKKSFTRICYLKLHIKYHRNAVVPVEIPFPPVDNTDPNPGPGETNQSAVVLKTRNYECYVCKQPFIAAFQLQDHVLQHPVYEQWVDPLEIYLSNWDPEESREIISQQPMVLVENLNIRNINLKSLADFGRPIENSIENPNEINEPDANLKFNPTVETDYTVAPDTTHTDCVDVVEILSDSDDDYDTIQNRLNNNAKLHAQPKFPETENPSTNELVYISSDDEEDITDSFHCFYCNGRFRTLTQFGSHEKICHMKGEPEF